MKVVLALLTDYFLGDWPSLLMDSPTVCQDITVKRQCLGNFTLRNVDLIADNAT